MLLTNSGNPREKAALEERETCLHVFQRACTLPKLRKKGKSKSIPTITTTKDGSSAGHPSGEEQPGPKASRQLIAHIEESEPGE